MTLLLPVRSVGGEGLSVVYGGAGAGEVLYGAGRIGVPTPAAAVVTPGQPNEHAQPMSRAWYLY